MATIDTIADVEPFFPGERPSNEKFTEEFTQKVNTINSNHVIINDALELLLQGVSGGAEQAKIPFAIASAPDGWTRDLSFTTDHLLRVTDGSTVPPGASPTANGGGQGGEWTITGISTVAESDHTHTMNGHIHSIPHTHAVGSHTHPISSHTHTIASHTHSIVNAGAAGTTFGTVSRSFGALSGALTFSRSHQHIVTDHQHGGTTGSDTGSNTASSGTTDSGGGSITNASPSQSDSNSSASGGGGSHNHTPIHDATWRPKYLNILVCSKD